MKTILALCCVLGGFAAFLPTNSSAATVIVENGRRHHRVYHRPYHRHYTRHHHVTVIHER